MNEDKEEKLDKSEQEILKKLLEDKKIIIDVKKHFDKEYETFSNNVQKSK